MRNLFVLACFVFALSLWAHAADEQTVTVTNASMGKNGVLVKAELEGKTIHLWCSTNGPFCAEPASGEYSMVRAVTADDAVYQDCTDVVLFKSSGVTKDKVGVYCWEDSGECYMSCGVPQNVEAIPFPMRKAVDPPPAEPTWEWLKTCKAGKRMRIELVMNGAVIHRSSFPICRMVRNVEPPQKRIEFSFTGGYVFQGEYHTKKTQRIEASFWQAGTERNTLLLGVSFTSDNQILLNTIHVANVNRASTSEIDRGIVVRTFPSTISGQ
jgi:hypothetical protein